MIETVIPVSRDEAVAFLGPGESNLPVIEEHLGVHIASRGGILRISTHGSFEKEQVQILFESMRRLFKKGVILSREDIIKQIDGIRNNKEENTKTGRAGDITMPVIIEGYRGCVRPKTSGQLEFYNSLRINDIVFAIGPAGTGKTFIAVAAAIQALQSGEIDRIIVTRPAIEAGENLGFLPGDLKDKINPYLKPIHDAFYAILTHEECRNYMKNGIIEIAPIAYMRGRTLNNSYAILDEAQNCTTSQMKMFLTRLGVNSKAVITGDITQIDLRSNITSGLVEIRNILHRIKGTAFCYLSSADVVRHSLVQKIINAYKEYEDKQQRNASNNNK